MGRAWSAALLAAVLPLSACAAGPAAAAALDARFVSLDARVEPEGLAEANPCVVTEDCQHALSHRGRRFDYVASHSLFQRNEKIHHAVILVHGLGGSAADTFDTLVAASTSEAGDKNTDLLLVAPHFADDISPDAPPDRHRWKRTRWASGARSVTRPRVSSFAILDGIVAEIVREGRFPGLRTLVLAGHSAGGQMIQRYAAIGRGENELPRARAIEVRYVVANPSSYLYLGETRPFFAPGPTGFGLPYRFDRGWKTTPRFEGAPVCPDTYDDYRYGLDDLNEYAEGVGAEAIVRQYPKREVVYLMGQLDAASIDCEEMVPFLQVKKARGFEACGPPNDGPEATACWCSEVVRKNTADLDRSCPAMLQGGDRIARARSYLDYMNTYFRGHRHRFVVVPFAHHSARAMFVSGEGANELFRVR